MNNRRLSNYSNKIELYGDDVDVMCIKSSIILDTVTEKILRESNLSTVVHEFAKTTGLKITHILEQSKNETKYSVLRLYIYRHVFHAEIDNIVDVITLFHSHLINLLTIPYIMSNMLKDIEYLKSDNSDKKSSNSTTEKNDNKGSIK